MRCYHVVIILFILKLCAVCCGTIYSDGSSESVGHQGKHECQSPSVFARKDCACVHLVVSQPSDRQSRFVITIQEIILILQVPYFFHFFLVIDSSTFRQPDVRTVGHPTLNILKNNRHNTVLQESKPMQL